MKRLMNVMIGIGVAALLCVPASTPAAARGSVVVNFGFGGFGYYGGYYRPYGYRYGYYGPVYSYCPPPPAPAYYYSSAPVYYYSGGVFYRR